MLTGNDLMMIGGKVDMVVQQTSTQVALDSLIEEIRHEVQAGGEPKEIADRVSTKLRPYLGNDELLTDAQKESDPNQYKQHVLHVEPDGSFSIVSLCWLPGQETPIHDHVSWCVVGVHQGLEFETTYDLKSDDDGSEWLSETGQVTCRPGDTEALTPPGDIHKVRNGGDDLAISIHIYGADIGKLGSSILRRYEQEVR